MKNRGTPEENALLNKYLIVAWAVLNGCILAAYSVELAIEEITFGYYAGFLIAALVPYALCVIIFLKNRASFWLRYAICLGYLIMYGCALFTGTTTRVYVYILPLVAFVVLYHDTRLMLGLGLVAGLLNVLVIVRDYFHNVITDETLYEYEIQIVMILLCFGGGYICSRLYNRICEKAEQRLQDLMAAQKEKVTLEERNKYLQIDAMTGMKTRRFYEEEIIALKKKMPKRLYITFVDVNGLKEVNDTYGHAEGDQVIMRAAEYIKQMFFEDCDHLYRIGGDEFTIISYGCKSNVNDKVELLRKTVEEGEKGRNIAITMAIGTASSKEFETVEEIFKAADERMYENKKAHYESAQYDRRRPR